jgi:hypothetical protein
MSIVDPTSPVLEKRHELAPRRLGTLDGARLGLLDNSKLNAAPLLAAIGDMLKDRYAVKSILARTKGHGFSYPVEDQLADEMAKECDIVIAAIGD